jgi:small subunit ribosomal protein S1
VKAFLPGSQVDLRPVRNLDKLIGQTYEFKVIKFNKKRGNIVLSRRVLLEKERDEMKQKTLETLEEGQVLDGTIKNLTEYGAFVDLGGIDGLLHITDMS